MKYWFSGDSHFFHSNILKYCNRPFETVEEMDEEIIRKWNEKVSPNDTVFHLGDFSFKKSSEYKQRLNGNIIHIKGNHDSSNDTIIQDMIIYIGGKYWHLAHKPEDCDGEYNLCAHVHSKWRVQNLRNNFGVTDITVNVGVDQWDFYPIDINQILNAIKEDDQNA